MADSKSRWLPSIYFLVGQIGWFACVLSAAHGMPWAGSLVAMAMVAAHLWRVPRPGVEMRLLASMVLLGGVWESVLVSSGLLAYPSGMVFPWVAPYWILAVWALFAAQFNTTYQWLKPHPWMAAVLGAVAGPLSFRAGVSLGALRFVRPWPAVLTLACGWALLLPVLVLLSRRWNGVEPRPLSGEIRR